MIRLITGTLLIAYCSAAFGQNPSFFEDSMDVYIERGMERWEIPAMAVGIVLNGEVVHAQGYGQLSLDSDQATDANSLFMIGSNSKAFVGLSMAMLAAEGKCQMRDPVKKYYPELKMWDPWITDHLNLTDILTHRMGMQTFQGDFMYWSSDFTREETIEKFGALDPSYDFRTSWGYTNAGYALASACIDEISGQDWKSYIDANIFTPLGMERSCLTAADMYKAENVAQPYVMKDGALVMVPFPTLGGIEACGSIGSSVAEMNNWMIMQLQNGMFNDEQVISEDAIRISRTPYALVGKNRHPYNRSNFEAYALGWEMIDYEGYEVVRHTGGVDGFVSSVTLVPQEGLGVVILTNTLDNLLFISLREEIIDAFLGLPYRDYDKLYFNYMSNMIDKDQKLHVSRMDTIESFKKLPLAAEIYAGQYTHTIYGDLEIVKKDKKSLELILSHHPGITAHLQPLDEARYLCTYSDPTFGREVLRFDMEDGTVKSLMLKVNPFLERGGYKFIKQ
jgi:CubicO group peptidase (beta-lactamase class C family)